MADASSAAVSPFSPAWRALSIGLLLTVLLIAFESLAVATVLPVVARDLRGLPLYGWAFSAFFMGYLLSTIVLGSLADRLGPARPFLIGLGLFALGLLVAGLAPNMPAFIAGRALQGLGGGGLVAVAYVVIGRAFPDNMRARMLALLSSAWVLPALIGPLAAGQIAALTSWRVVFVGLLPLLLLALALAWPAMRGLSGHGTPVNLGRARLALFAALGVTGVLAALQQRSWLPAAALGLGGLLLALPALRGLFPPGVWRLRRPLDAGYATRFVLTFTFFGAEAFVPLGLTDLHGLTPTGAGLALTASALTWSTSSILHSRFDERTEGRYRHRVALIGTTFVTLSLIATGFVLTTPDLPAWPGVGWLVAPAWALGGLGMGLAFQSHTLVVLRRAPEGQEGEVSGTLQTADVLGSAIGAGLGGVLVATIGLRGGITALFALTVAVALLGQLTTRRLATGAATAHD